MAAGDTTDELVSIPLTTANKASIKALRNSANDKWLAVPVANGQQILVINKSQPISGWLYLFT